MVIIVVGQRHGLSMVMTKDFYIEVLNSKVSPLPEGYLSVSECYLLVPESYLTFSRMTIGLKIFSHKTSS